MDGSQLKPFHDPDFIHLISRFFLRRTSDTDKWLLSLTGGEPLLMPNLELFINTIGSVGNKFAIYTALMVGESSPAYNYLLHGASPHVDYIMASFHAEAEKDIDKWFSRLLKLKDAGHTCIVRFVGHPNRLALLPTLSAKCVELNIAFYPTTLFSPEYPQNYSISEIETLTSYFSTLSQVIQLNGGLDTSATKCLAGTSLFAVYLRTGNITPCISVNGPILGNIYEDQLTPINRLINCPSPSSACSCDIHFQQGVVLDADDTILFEALKKGISRPLNSAAAKSDLINRGHSFSKNRQQIGQTSNSRQLSLSNEFVLQAYTENLSSIRLSQVSENHPVILKYLKADDLLGN
jgi:hypothetical protein